MDHKRLKLRRYFRAFTSLYEKKDWLGNLDSNQD